MELIVLIFIAYWIILEILSRSGILKKFELEKFGPILLVRTKKGLNFIERVAKAKKFWTAFANAGLPIVFLGMVFMFALILLVDYILLTSPPQPSELTSPRAALLIPGINPFIPVVWGTIGLVVTLVVHEFSHAILCRVEGIKVKSLGVILALVPIGAFAEPKEDELFDKNLKKLSRMRVFSSGVLSNFFVAFISFAIFFQILSFLNPAVLAVDDAGNIYRIVEINGIKISDREDTKAAAKLGSNEILIEKDGKIERVSIYGAMGVRVVDLYREDGIYPAELAGMKKGMVIVSIDGSQIKTVEDFYRKMSETKPMQRVTVRAFDGESIKEFNVTLAEKNGRGFLGVIVQTNDYFCGYSLVYGEDVLKSLKSIPELMMKPEGWLILIAMPFQFPGFMDVYEKMFQNPSHIFWILNTFYWIGWINFYVGLFNCLPAVPLDGGRIFQEMMLSVFRNSKKGEEVTKKLTKIIAIFVFLSIALSFVIPNLGRL